MNLTFINEQREGYVFLKIYDKGEHVADAWRIFNKIFIEFKIGQRKKVVLKDVNPENLLENFKYQMGRAYAKN